MVTRKDVSTAAATLGRLGGKSTTEAKAEAARENGKLGGRPSITLSDKMDEIRALKSGGASYADIARVYGVSRARIHQLFKKHIKTEKPETCQKCGRAGALNAHHTNYTTDEVVYLCGTCHRREHMPTSPENPNQEPMTNAQRQARRLALLNEAAIAAGWTGWRQYETAIITGRAKMNTNNSLLDCIAHGTSHSDFLASFGGDVDAAVQNLRDFYVEQLEQSGEDVPTNADMRVMVRDAKRALEKLNA